MTQEVARAGEPDAYDATTEKVLRAHEDPFFDAPKGLGRLAPGTVVRTRRVRVGFLGLVPQRRLRAWQVAYRSTDLEGRPELAVTTVIAPRVAKGRALRGLVAYQCAIDAVSDKCFPSYALRLGANAWGSLPQLEMFLICAVLQRGFAVSVADHEGRAGTFAAPREPGHRVLDGIRAAFTLSELDLDATTPVGLMGYSGGGMASAWAAEMAPSYAPELNLVGAAMGSPVGDPGETFVKLNGGPFAGLPALVVSGLRHVYPGLGRVVRQHATLDGMRRLNDLERSSTVRAIMRYGFDDFDDYIDEPLADVLASAEIQEVFNDLRLGRRAPACPLLVVQSIHDQIIDVRDVDGQVERYAEGEADVLYLRDRASEHISLLPLAFPAMLGWLEHRFAMAADPDGAHEPSTGRRECLSVALAPRTWPGFLRMGEALCRAALGAVG